MENNSCCSFRSTGLRGRPRYRRGRSATETGSLWCRVAVYTNGCTCTRSMRTAQHIRTFFSESEPNVGRWSTEKKQPLFALHRPSNSNHRINIVIEVQHLQLKEWRAFKGVARANEPHHIVARKWTMEIFHKFFNKS